MMDEDFDVLGDHFDDADLLSFALSMEQGCVKGA
jgi:hypothetical protein